MESHHTQSQAVDRREAGDAQAGAERRAAARSEPDQVGARALRRCEDALAAGPERHQSNARKRAGRFAARALRWTARDVEWKS